MLCTATDRIIYQCGKAPFARVAKCGISDDQRVPAHARSRVTRRYGNQTQVHVLSLDTDFDKVDTSR